LVYCHAVCTYQAILNALDLSASNNGNGSLGPYPSEIRANSSYEPDEADNGRGTPVAKYDYNDEVGNLRFQIVRYESRQIDGSIKKSFVARKRPGIGEIPAKDGWVYRLNGISLIPYNLPEIVNAELVYVVEGEKDVETLKAFGLPATCNPFGAGKWRDEFSNWFSGKTAVILPDNDEAGKAHAQAVAASLYTGAREVLVINLPGLPEKGDVTDFAQRIETVDDLISLVERAEPWAPAQSSAVERLTKFRFSSLNQLLSEPPEETSFIWEKTLPAGGFSICSAKPKVGKSTLARNLAVAIEAGSPFLGRATVRGRVLYLCLEEKRSEIRNHFERMGTSSDEILIHTGSTPENAIHEIAVAIAEFEPILVIVDPLSRVIRAGDFNDYGQMTRALEPIVDLARKTGSHILGLHHDSKMGAAGGDGVLGSTALFGSVDCHIQLRKRDGARTLNTTQRYGEDIPETVIEMEKETGLVIDSGSLSDHLRNKAKDAILAEIKPGEEVGESEIKNRIEGFNAGVKAMALRDLVDEGKVTRKGEGKKGNPYIYVIDGKWVM
jgi:hypothetical protein